MVVHYTHRKVHGLRILSGDVSGYNVCVNEYFEGRVSALRLRSRALGSYIRSELSSLWLAHRGWPAPYQGSLSRFSLSYMPVSVSWTSNKASSTAVGIAGTIVGFPQDVLDHILRGPQDRGGLRVLYARSHQ